MSATLSLCRSDDGLMMDRRCAGDGVAHFRYHFALYPVFEEGGYRVFHENLHYTFWKGMDVDYSLQVL